MCTAIHPARVLLATAASLALLATAGGSMLYAQDSVASGACAPGDSVRPWDDASAPTGSTQRQAYVVARSPFQAGWGTEFGIAPLLKTSAIGGSPAGASWSATAMSRVEAKGVPFASSAYDLWHSPGYGANPDPAFSLDPLVADSSSSFGHRFGVALSEFGTTGSGGDYNGVITATVDVSPTSPGAFLVTRTVAATNGCDDASNLAQFGLGSVDADGTVHFRADAFGVATGCGLTPIAGDHVFRVRGAERDAASRNVVSADYALGGGFDVPATDQIVAGLTGETHVTPGLVDSGQPGVEPLYLGTDFSSNYWRGIGSASSDQSHIGPLISETRGNLSTSQHVFRILDLGGQGVATAATLGLDAGGKLKGVNLFGVDAVGEVTGTLGLTLPAVIGDDTSWFSTTTATCVFTNNLSQVSFAGGNGQVALGRDLSGRLLVAATVNQSLGQTNLEQFIAVARVDPWTAAVEWTVAAHSDPWLGKELLDGPGGAPVGKLTGLAAVTGIPLDSRPCLSSPMLDAVGNVWFMAPVERYDSGGGPSTFGLGIVRAVYEPNLFDYELELVTAVGDVFHGGNSGLDYQLSELSLVDSNSISSGAPFSQNISGEAHLGQSIYGLQSADPRTLGGLVVGARVTYDVDGDGSFAPCSNGDQEYNVLLHLGALEGAADIDDNYIADGAQVLRADATSIYADAASTVGFTIEAGPEHAGWPYILLGSLSGTSPGIPVGGQVLPLNIDAYFLQTLANPNSPPLSGSFGVLDSFGHGVAGLTTPPGLPPEVIDAILNHAVVLIDMITNEFIVVEEAVPTKVEAKKPEKKTLKVRMLRLRTPDKNTGVETGRTGTVPEATQTLACAIEFLNKVYEDQAQVCFELCDVVDVVVPLDLDGEAGDELDEDGKLDEDEILALRNYLYSKPGGVDLVPDGKLVIGPIGQFDEMEYEGADGQTKTTTPSGVTVGIPASESDGDPKEQSEVHDHDNLSFLADKGDGRTLAHEVGHCLGCAHNKGDKGHLMTSPPTVAKKPGELPTAPTQTWGPLPEQVQESKISKAHIERIRKEACDPDKELTKAKVPAGEPVEPDPEICEPHTGP